MAEKSGAPDPMHQFEIVELVEFKLFDLNLKTLYSEFIHSVYFNF